MSSGGGGSSSPMVANNDNFIGRSTNFRGKGNMLVKNDDKQK